MLVIAHRGANREGLENSWDAYEKAIAGGSDRIELDIQLTRDGHAVIMHDDSLLRMTGVQNRCSMLTRDELTELRLVNGEKIPFLDEVVERLLPRIELNIEIKGASGAGEVLADVVAKVLGKHSLRDKIIVSCFHAEPLVRLYQREPELRRACLWNMTDTFSWPYFATLAPQVFLTKCRTNILHPHIGLVTDNLMDQANARGWMVYAWAEMVGEERDREGLWANLKTLGVHGLCTNYPRQLKTWLEDAAIDEFNYRQYRQRYVSESAL